MGGFELIVILACMLGEAFFSGMETGVISIHRMRLRHMVEEGSRRAKVLHEFLEHSDRLLGTTLVGTNICVVVASVAAASFATRMLPPWGKAVSSVTLAVLLLVFSEYLPKAWFRGRPLERCIMFTEPLQASWHVLRPIGAAVTWLTKGLVPGPGSGLASRAPFVTREELKIIARELGRNGVITPRERVMIHRVFELSSRQAGQVMIPRAQMTLVDGTTTVPELLDTARASGFTRLPVYDKQREHFSGIVNVFDALSADTPAEDATVTDYMRAPQFIPEDMPVDDILPRMRRLRQPMCLVTSGESEVTGLITTEDVLEEIVGKL